MWFVFECTECICVAGIALLVQGIAPVKNTLLGAEESHRARHRAIWHTLCHGHTPHGTGTSGGRGGGLSTSQWICNQTPPTVCSHKLLAAVECIGFQCAIVFCFDGSGFKSALNVIQHTLRYLSCFTGGNDVLKHSRKTCHRTNHNNSYHM